MKRRCPVSGIRCHVLGVGFMSQVRVMNQEPELLSRRCGQGRKVSQGAARGENKNFRKQSHYIYENK